MGEYEPLEIRGYYRSHSHLPIWEVMDKAGIWERVGLNVTFEFCDSSSAAEKALFDGSVDFVSGNHISPYLLVRRGKPIVSLTSPSNSVNDKLVARFPIKQVSELRGKRIGDTTLVDSIGGYHHPRGNHMLYVMRGGLRLDEVEFVELTESNKEFHSDAARSCQVRQSRRDLCHRKYGQVRAGRLACFVFGSAAHDQWSDIDIDVDHLAEKSGIGGTVGESTSDGYPLRAYSKGRDGRYSRRIASPGAGSKKRRLSQRGETITEALSGS